MKAVYHGHHSGEKVGISLPVLDLHGRPLINASLVTADDPRAAFLITADKPFTLNHKNYEQGINWVSDWIRTSSQKSFRILDTELLPPDGVNIGVGIEAPPKKEKKNGVK
jgi:hypothetical protein